VVGAVSPQEEAIKPGPGTYTLPDDINGHYIMRGSKSEWTGPPAPKMGMPLRVVNDQQGEAIYDVRGPTCKNTYVYFDDADKCSTFGFHRRWEDEKSIAKTSQSPIGSLYYSHVKMNDEQHPTKSSSLGIGERPELLPSQHFASPATYYPVTGCSKPSSSLDGWVQRNLSPITQFSKVTTLGGSSSQKTI